MSFAGSARKALDSSLPLGHRVNALCKCLEHYSPAGYEASFSFLKVLASDFTRDPAAMLPAMELLSASYTAWQAELRAYAVLRRYAKRLGYRVPRPSSANPEQAIALVWRTARGRPSRRVVLVLEGRFC